MKKAICYFLHKSIYFMYKITQSNTLFVSTIMKHFLKKVNKNNRGQTGHVLSKLYQLGIELGTNCTNLQINRGIVPT